MSMITCHHGTQDSVTPSMTLWLSIFITELFVSFLIYLNMNLLECPKAQGKALTSLVSSDKPPKRYSVYNCLKQRKICESEKLQSENVFLVLH